MYGGRSLRLSIFNMWWAKLPGWSLIFLNMLLVHFFPLSYANGWLEGQYIRAENGLFRLVILMLYYMNKPTSTLLSLKIGWRGGPKHRHSRINGRMWALAHDQKNYNNSYCHILSNLHSSLLTREIGFCVSNHIYILGQKLVDRHRTWKLLNRGAGGSATKQNAWTSKYPIYLSKLQFIFSIKLLFATGI